MSFAYSQFKCQTFLFDPEIRRPFQELQLAARVDLGTMTIKRYSTFPNAPATDCLVSYSGHSLLGGGLTPPNNECPPHSPMLQQQIV